MNATAEIALPDAVRAAHTMLSGDELALLYDLGRSCAGRGDIIDAGAFLGGSTIALGHGLLDNAGRFEKHGRIHSYDYFRADRFTRRYLPHLAEGDSTRSHYDSTIAAVRDLIEVHEGDIAAFPWPAERPIEVLFIDIAKTWATNDFVVNQFFPRLIPGVSTIVQQDYHWSDVPWIAITMELFRDRFEYLGSMPWATAVYRCRHAISAGDIPARLRDLPASKLLSLLAAAQRWRPGSWEWATHECNEVALRLWLGATDDAARVYRQVHETAPAAVERLQYYPPALVSRLQ